VAIDYRSEERKLVGELRGDIGAIRKVLNLSFRKPRSSPHKKQTVQPKMHLKIPLSSQGLEFVKL
jgi:hypothetical protein